VPPVPFSACNTPLVLYWDFPENYYHTLASYATLWAAVRAGAISRDVSVALGLPIPYLSSPGGALADFLTTPLAAIFDGPVTTLPRLSAQGGGRDEAGEEAGGAHAAQARAERGWGGRLALPRVRCFARTPVCSIAGYSERPPLHFYEFMQAVKDELLGRPRNYDGSSPALVPYVWPDGKRFVTRPDGVLRVTIAVRDVGTRRVLNMHELLGACTAAGALVLPAADSSSGGGGASSSVPIACEAYAFGSGPQGLASDAARMHATDVLVAVHGAGLTNLGFLRPGSLVVELRPSKFRGDNGDRFYRPMAADAGCLKWWGVVLFRAYEPKGRLEVAGQGDPDQWGRDHDLVLPWRGLAEALSRALPLAWPAWAAAERAGKVFTEVAPGERGFR